MCNIIKMRPYLHLRKLLIIIHLFLTTSLYAQSKINLESTIQLRRTSGTVAQFLSDLQQDYSLSFAYDQSILPPHKFKAHKNRWQLEDFLQRLLQKAQLGFKLINHQVVIKKQENTKVTIHGTITGKADGEQLIGATVYIKELRIGTVTNTYGFYSLTIPPGKYTFVYSYIGHQRQEHTLMVKQEQVLDVALVSSVDHLGEVVIKAKQEKDIESIRAVQMSAHQVEITQIKTTPMLAGEADALKSIQFLPGIQNGSEGTASFSVRGGSYDQNLILLDGAPVYNVSHALGFFSVFNVDALKNIQVYKGGIPAKYGGRLSSVVDIRMKEGNDQKFSVNGGIGLVGSRLMLEGPIGKNVSYMVAGRYGYLGHTGNLAAQYLQGPIPGVKKFGENNEIDFYDLNAKINVQLNPHNKIYFSAFMGNDHFFNDLAFENNTLDWGNQTGTFRWNHIYNSRLFSNLTLIYSNFDYSYTINNDSQSFKWLANQQQQAIKLDFDYFASPKHTFNFGAALHYHRFSPGKVEPLSDLSSVQALALDTKNAVETAWYISHEYKVTPKLLINYGVRVSSFHNIGSGIQYIYNEAGQLQEEKSFANNEIMNTYFGLAPRFSARYLINPHSSIKVSYNRTYQYLHLVSNSSIGLPTDVWLPVDNNIKPRFADQVALGYFKELKEATYSVSVEAYYKWMNQVIDYKDNANIFLNQNIETQIRTGQGKAYGLELMFEKKKGKLKGWISYTLSRVEQTIAGVNNNQTYAPRHDRRHNLSLVLSYDLGRRWQISTNYSYITGAGITVPRGIFDFGYGDAVQQYSARNAFRLPAFHQLDIGIKLKSNRKKRWQGEWIFGVTNAYNRKNPITYYVSGTDLNERVSQLYLFGLMPSINYNFKF